MRTTYDMATNTITATCAKRRRMYEAREEGGGSVKIMAATQAQAMAAAIAWCESGEYDPDETGPVVRQTVWVRPAGRPDLEESRRVVISVTGSTNE